MRRTLDALWNDENGFVFSAELVLVATICVIGILVGLTEVQHGIVDELNDIGDAVGSLNQSYSFGGFRTNKKSGNCKAEFSGSFFVDLQDDCDNNQCDLSCTVPIPEAPKW